MYVGMYVENFNQVKKKRIDIYIHVRMDVCM